MRSEEFVANLLCAMGYRCAISPQGGDSGIDITAYKDELPPRILVQVKSQDGDIKKLPFNLSRVLCVKEIMAFCYAFQLHEECAKVLREHPIIRGINGTELVDLV